MTAEPCTNEGRCAGTTGTLGDLLCADKAKTRVSEKDWVGLVQSVAAGDQRALHALYERPHRIVFTLTMRITNNRESAEELTRCRRSLQPGAHPAVGFRRPYQAMSSATAVGRWLSWIHGCEAGAPQ